MTSRNRVWFITGASSGFGRALAEAVIANGERVAVAARRQSALRDLEAKGVAVVPTIWPDAAIRIDETMRSLGWEQAIVKPRVSATAHKTYLTSAADTGIAQPILGELMAGPGALLQKFMAEIQVQGEWSFVFFKGHISHPGIKSPKPGDFSGQQDLGAGI